MSRRTLIVFAAAALGTGPAAGQTPPNPTPAAAPPPAAAPSFPPGAEVLSVDGEPLGVLARMELRPDGERILHIRRPDGTLTAAPASAASRGERAVVLEWTRAQVEAPAPAVATATPADPPPPPVL